MFCMFLSRLVFNAESGAVKAAVEALSIIEGIVTVVRDSIVSGTEIGLSWSIAFLDEVVDVPLPVVTWFGYGCGDCAAMSQGRSTSPTKQFQVRLDVGSFLLYAYTLINAKNYLRCCRRQSANRLEFGII